jgi:hypothetical protein
VEQLLACPFCRELFAKAEHERCPNCDVKLIAMHKLPPSLEVRAELDAETPPELTALPWTYWRRGRGALIALSILGIAFFFGPWIELVRPELTTVSGYELAHSHAGWLWGGVLGYFIMIPLVFTRRHVRALRGVRVICTVLALMTLSEVAMLVLVPPAQSSVVRVEFHFGWALIASGVVSLLATLVALRLGGKVEDLRELPRAETSAGHTVH